MPEFVPSRKIWTHMIYMGGFNDLDPFVLEDLKELETVGSTDRVNIVVQADLASQRGVANRHYITKNNAETFSSPIVGQTESEPNVGDPREVIDFVRFCVTNYPADHYMLTFWGHGLGVFDKKNADTGRANVIRSAFSTIPYQLGTALAKPVKIEEVRAKLVVIDPETDDALTDREIGEMSQAIKAAIGKNIDVVHFDACYMATLELARQTSAFADYMVASQYIVPYQGMPYGSTGIAALLNSEVTPREVTSGLVSAFLDFYGADMHNDKVRATISAIDLAHVPKFCAAVDALANALTDYLAEHPTEGLANLNKVRAQTNPNLGFSPDEWDPGDDIGDLFAFAQAIRYPGLPRLLESTASAVDSLRTDVIFAEGHGGKDFTQSSVLNGLTVYLPKFRGDAANPYRARAIDYPYQYEANNPAWFAFIDRFQFPTQAIGIDLEAAAALKLGNAEGIAELRNGACAIASFAPDARSVTVSLNAIHIRLKWPRQTEIRWQVGNGQWSFGGEISAAGVDNEAAIAWEMPTNVTAAVLRFSVQANDQEYELLSVPIRLFQRHCRSLLIYADGDIDLGDEVCRSIDCLTLADAAALGPAIIAAYSDGVVIRSQPRVTKEYALGTDEIKAYLALLDSGGHVVLAGRDVRYAIETERTPEARALLAGSGSLVWSEPDFAAAGDHVELSATQGGPLNELPAIMIESRNLQYGDVMVASGAIDLLQFSHFGACAVAQPFGHGRLTWVGFNLASLPTAWMLAFCIALSNMTSPSNLRGGATHAGRQDDESL